MLITIFPLFLQKIGPTEIILILAVILVFFGGRKIPELMRGMGRGMKEFKDAVNKDYSKEADKNDSTEAIEEAPRKAVSSKSTAEKSAAKRS